MFYSPEFQDVICAEQEPVGVFATGQFYVACCERGTNLISAQRCSHGAVSGGRYGTNESSGYSAVVNSPRPVACSQQPAQTLGIAQSCRMAHQLISPSQNELKRHNERALLR